MTNAEKILRKSLDVAAYQALVESTCRTALTSPQAAHLFMARYADINAYAASGVVSLVGNIGYANIFKSQRIASHIFNAAVDEYRGDHKLRAQECVDAIARYASISKAPRKSVAFTTLVEAFKQSYAGDAKKLPSLLRGIGYHVASEYLADLEFRHIDKVMRHENSDKRFHQTVIRKHWSWINAHAQFDTAGTGHGVEHDHFLEAAQAFDEVLKDRPHGLTVQQTRELMTQGIRKFAKDWTAVFKEIGREIRALP